jgi:hypothetical protein
MRWSGTPGRFDILAGFALSQDIHLLSFAVASQCAPINGQVFSDGFALGIWAEITPLYEMSD